jgi:long-subunit fatty acid transport protein
MWGVLAIVAAGLVSSVLPDSARADSTHYQTLQLGERSRGMAGAFTAFAADGAAIWYNPAGLPFLEAKLLQGSLSLIQKHTVDIEGAIVSDGPDGVGGEDQVEDFKLDSSPSLPGFAVASFALGKPKEELDDRKPLQMAISAFQTYNNEFGGDINIQDEFGRTSSLQFYQKDRMTYFGAGFGYRPARNFSFGITLLASNRKIEHVETTSLVIGGVQDPSLGSPCPTSPTIPFCVIGANQASRNTVFSMSSWDLSFRIGLLQLMGKRWRFGLMFQPPGFRVGGKSKLRFELSEVRSANNPNNPSLSDSVFGDRKFDARSPIPWELRLGVSYVLSKRVVVAADLQLVGPVAGGSIAPGIPQLEGRANTSGILLADSTKREFTWNISLGSEVQITKFLFTRFGFLTDNSSAPAAATGAADAIRPSKIDRYGFSASIGGHKDGKGLSAGVSVLFGKGEGNGLDFTAQAFDNDTNFIRVPVKERILIISVGGDIGQTAGVVKTRVKEKKSEEELEQEKEAEREAQRQDMEEETDPEVKAAKERAVEARAQADSANERAEEAEQEAKKLELLKKSGEGENLDDGDQGAIQDSTQTGIETIR